MLAPASLLANLKRCYPVVAFFAGFVWDALTIGQRVRGVDFWRLGGFLVGAAVLTLWLARRDQLEQARPVPVGGLRGRVRGLAWQAPYLLLQFFFGGIFSALFILYFKSSGHLGTWTMAAFLGVLLVANEFIGERYGRRFTLTWGLFGLNAILLCNFLLPHLVGSLNPGWFYLSTGLGVLLAHGLWLLAPGRPGRILPAWILGAVLLGAWKLDMVAPVPLVKRDIAVGQQFQLQEGRYSLMVENAPDWQFWRDQAAVAHVPDGERLFGVSAVFAPFGVSAPLEHRWEVRDESGSWRVAARSRFQATGGREKGFRGYSWILNPQPGPWRFIVATQDGRTIATLAVLVERGTVPADGSRLKEL